MRNLAVRIVSSRVIVTWFVLNQWTIFHYWNVNCLLDLAAMISTWEHLHMGTFAHAHEWIIYRNWCQHLLMISFSSVCLENYMREGRLLSFSLSLFITKMTHEWHINSENKTNIQAELLEHLSYAGASISKVSIDKLSSSKSHNWCTEHIAKSRCMLHELSKMNTKENEIMWQCR